MNFSKIDRGETTAQTVLALPVLMMIMLLGIQATIVFHAGNVATAAATQGATAVAGLHGDFSSGSLRISQIVDDLGATLIGSPSIATDGRDVIVTVRIKTPKLVPGFSGVVTRTARAPIEQFIYEIQR